MSSRDSHLLGETLELPVCPVNDVYVGPYRVLQKLGEGGMGEVYLAEDLRLGRKIALKMLPPRVTENLGCVSRFVREAKAASALNHPNIITIFDIGEADGKHYMATEYVQGQTLRDRIATQVPIEIALDIGIQMAGALKAAHDAGIIHRDIKPENVMLRPDGLVKILDFGVAKLIGGRGPLGVSGDAGNEESAGDGDTTYDPYLTTPENSLDGTSAGVLRGTFSYMSPEQIRGLKLDARSDIFSFGVLLYEVITGRRPFIGGTEADKLAAILDREPAALTDYRSDVPPELERIIGVALRKDRDARYQTTKDILADLVRLKEELEFRKKLGGSSKLLISARLEGLRALAVRSRRRLAFGAIAAFALTVAGLYWSSHRTTALTDKDTIVVADLINTTGDQVFDLTLRQALASQLEQSPFLSLVSDERITQTLGLMERPKNSRLTQQLAREVAQRTGSKATIEGAISGHGEHYELQLKVIECQSSDVLVSLHETVDGKEQMLRLLGKLAASLREKLGESLASVQGYDAPADSVTTGSLDALQAYSLGYKTSVVNADFPGAISLFDRAVRLDPNFAMAYARLASSYNNLSDTTQCYENSRKAYDLRQRVSERERFYIESGYQTYVTENLEAARAIYEAWAQTYPRDYVPWNSLRNIYSVLGEYDKELAAIQESLRLEPQNVVSHMNLVRTYIELDRLDEAKAAIQEAQLRNLDSPELHSDLYLIAHRQHDGAAIDREAVYLMRYPAMASLMLSIESQAAAYTGRLSRARELANRVVDLELPDHKDQAAADLVQAAMSEALLGNLAFAKSKGEEALRLSDNKYVEALAAVIFGLSGDRARATRIADGLAHRCPESTSLKFHFLPMIRAAAALQDGDSAKAIEAFVTGAPYELGIPVGMAQIKLYPVYLRAQAYLAAHQASLAAEEFQKILDHPGLVGNEVIGALSHLGLGRACALAGDPVKAKTSYQNFLAVWKDADPDIVILQQARAEYSRLN